VGGGGRGEYSLPLAVYSYTVSSYVLENKACPLDDVSRSYISVSANAEVFYVCGVAVIFDVSGGVGGGSDICLHLPAFPKSVQQTQVS
jgi:hypothetical protein